MRSPGTIGTPIDEITLWPPTASALTDLTLCPACFTALRKTTCPRCGLRLDGPRSAAFEAAADAIAVADVERRLLVERVRAEIAAEDAAYAATLSREVEVDLEAEGPQELGPLPVAPPAVRPPRLVTQHEPSGRSGVQILLLTVGVVLVSVTAVFFALVAYLVTSAEVRAGLLVALAGCVLALAAWLRPRLPGTAEGLGALSAVVLGLDGGLIRTQHLFGTARLDSALFVGLYSLVVAAVLFGAARVTGLKALNRAALVAVPLAAIGIGAGVSDSGGTRVWAGAAAAAAVWLVPLLVDRGGRRRADALSLDALDRGWIAVMTTGPLIVATFAAFLSFPDRTGAAPVALLAVVALWFVQATRGSGGPRSHLATFSAGCGGAAAAMLPVAALVSAQHFAPAGWVVVVASAAIAALLALAHGRVPGAGNRLLARPAAICALALTSAVALPWVVSAILVVGQRVPAWIQAVPFRFSARTPQHHAAIDLFGTGPWTMLVGLALAAVLAGAAARLLRAPVIALMIPASALGLALLAAAVGDASAVVDALGLTLLGAGAVAVVWWRRVPAGLRLTAAAVALASAGALFALAPVTHALWLPAVAATLVLLAGLRGAARDAAPEAAARFARGGSTFVTLAVLFAASARVPGWWAPAGADPHSRLAAGAVVLCAVLVLAVIAVAPLVRGLRLATAADLTMGSLASVLALVVGGSVLAPVDGGARVGSVVLLGLLTAVALLWMIAPAPERGIERGIAAVVAPVAFVTGAAQAVRAADGGTATLVVVASGAVLVAALGSRLLLGTASPGPGPGPGPAGSRRLLWDAALGATTLGAAAAAVAEPRAWPALLLLAGAALVAASQPGNPLRILAGDRPRDAAAWAAPVLAGAALWTALWRAHVTTVEAYSLPVAGLLVLLAVAIAAARTAFEAEPAPGAVGRAPVAAVPTGLLALGLAAAAVPTLAYTNGAALARPFAVVVAAALAVTAATLVPHLAAARLRGLDARTPLAAVGAAALVGLALVRGFGARRIEGGFLLETHGVAWALLVAALVLGTATLWALRPHAHRAAPFAPAAGATGIVALILVTLSTQIEGPATVVHAVGIGAVLAVLSIGAAILRALAPTIDASGTGALPRLARLAPLAATVRVSALIGASVLAAGALVTSVFDGLPAHLPFESVTLPVAVAALVAGATRMQRDLDVSSWRALGYGLAVLLGPGLLADYVDVHIWRIVLLGGLAVATLLAGARWRLQAPLLVGGTVTVLHAIAQLWPSIVALGTSVPWWLWAGAGGVLLIVVAATYERRVQQARLLGHSVASLR